jgi:FkbM family methyltransferase
MGLKQWINSALRYAGYRLARIPSLDGDIASGKFRWLSEYAAATVLDIGANEGQFAEMARRVFPGAIIYSFEPLRDCHAILEEKSASLQPMRCFRCALGKEAGTAMIHHNDFSPSSSLLPMGSRHREAFPHTRNAILEAITIRLLDDVAPELTLVTPILMKVDVQGFELDVLAGAVHTLPRIDTIIVETSFVELYEGQPLFQEIADFLRARGFTYMGNLEQVTDPSNGAILQADAIFARRHA